MAGADARVIASMQLGNGSWKLSNLAMSMGRSKRDLEAKCPTPLSGNATMAVAWATVLAVTVLQQVRDHHMSPHDHTHVHSLLPSLSVLLSADEWV